MKIKERLKRKYYITLCITLSLFLYIIIFNIYSSKVSPKLYTYAKVQIKNDIYSNILRANKLLLSSDTDKILNVYKNDEGQILYIDYDLNKTYKLLDNYVSYIKENVLSKNIIAMPFFVSSDNILLSSLGPKMLVKYETLNNIIALIKTKITDFGVNNALLEIYFEVNINYLITMPIKKEKTMDKFDILISSKVINGKVPSFYGENIIKSNGFTYSN